jgi:hypothetical protein
MQDSYMSRKIILRELISNASSELHDPVRFYKLIADLMLRTL